MIRLPGLDVDWKTRQLLQQFSIARPMTVVIIQAAEWPWVLVRQLVCLLDHGIADVVGSPEALS